jgi:DNA-binding response OmpR family regulator
MGSSHPGRVAIVEDDPLMASFLEEILTDAGYDVVGKAATATDAISLIGWQQPDLALLDIRLMGRRSGVDVAQEVTRRYGTGVIFETSESNEAVRRQAESTGPFGWLTKPFEPEELLAAVDAAMGEIRARTRH